MNKKYKKTLEKFMETIYSSYQSDWLPKISEKRNSCTLYGRDITGKGDNKANYNLYSSDGSIKNRQ